METLVILASHVHHVPHVGFPQIEPEAMFRPRNTSPTSTAACASWSPSVRRVNR